MPKPTKQWTKPFMGLEHYTGNGYHAIVDVREVCVGVSILPLNADNTWKGHSAVDRKVFRLSEHVDAIATAKAWAEAWTLGQEPNPSSTSSRTHAE